MNRRDKQILEKIASEIDYLQSLVNDIEETAFLNDETAERAAAMTAINIGELAKRLSDQFYEEYPHSELRMAAKTRDVYAHGYFTLSFATVYKTAIEDYPRVRIWIEEALRQSARQKGEPHDDAEMA